MRVDRTEDGLRAEQRESVALERVVAHDDCPASRDTSAVVVTMLVRP